ncbi:MAG: hypothetical protein AAF270_14230 [Pseudomonadota bacterium]
MGVIVAVTSGAGQWRFVELCICGVATCAAQVSVREFQRKICESMIKQPIVAIDDIRVASFVVGMTSHTVIIFGCCHLAVETRAILAIHADVFMASQAKRRTCNARLRRVT